MMAMPSTDRRLSRRAALVAAMGLFLGCGEEFSQAESPPPSGPCNGPGVFSETFEDGTLSDLLEPQGQTETSLIQEQQGTLVLAPDASSGELRVSSTFAFDLRGSAVVVEVPVAADGTPGTANTYLDVTWPYDWYLSMGRSGDELSLAVQTESGSDTNALPYEPTAHRWWRIAEADDEVSFDTSADGTTWTAQWQAPTPAFVEASYLTLGVWHDGQAAEPVEAHFDNLNPEGASFCGLSQPHLTFDAEPGIGWDTWENEPCAWSVTGGRLEALIPTGGAGECGLVSRYGFSLRGESLTIAFAELPPAAQGTRVELSLRSSGGDRADYVTLEHGNGELHATAVIGSIDGNGTATLGSGPSWWRIRDDGRNLVLEVSTDGAEYEPVRELIVDELPPAFDIYLRYVNTGQEQDARLAIDQIN